MYPAVTYFITGIMHVANKQGKLVATSLRTCLVQVTQFVYVLKQNEKHLNYNVVINAFVKSSCFFLGCSASHNAFEAAVKGKLHCYDALTLQTPPINHK